MPTDCMRVARLRAKRNEPSRGAGGARRGVLALPLLATLLGGCELGVSPTEQVAPELATGTLTGVQALLTGVYARLRSAANYGNQMLLLPDVMADNTVPATPTNSYAGHHRNDVGSHMAGWGSGSPNTVGRYHAINEANYTIASAEALTGDDAARNRIIGEALFLRALNYHDLARIFSYEPNRIVNGWDKGAVLRTEPTRTAAQAEPRERSTVLETYQLIESDLRRSIDLLAAHGRNDPFFASRAAAEALLARVYLYWERWEDAATYAGRAMQGSPGRLAAANEYATMFDRAPNPESLFELNYDAATESLWVNDCPACFTMLGGTWFSVLPSQELLALYEPGDARLGVYATAPSGAVYTTKYTNSQGANTDNSIVIRFSELLLIRAEAYAMSGQEDLARADLNTLRAARNVGPVTASGDALIAAIMNERRRELAFEGHRWFDLKRRGMNIPKPAQGANPVVPYTDFRILAPVPSTEVLNNPLIVQNPGY